MEFIRKILKNQFPNQQFHQQEANNINWSQLFYDYMKNGQAKSCNLLIPSKLDAYHEIILLTINDLADVRDSAEVYIAIINQIYIPKYLFFFHMKKGLTKIF